MKKKSVIWIVILLVLCFAFGLTAGIMAGQLPKSIIHSTIVVKDGVVQQEEITNALNLKKDGIYNIHLKWSCEKNPGLVVGAVLTDRSGKVYAAATADIADCRFGDREMAAGEYTVRFDFFTDNESLSAFAAKYDMKDMPDNGVFAGYAANASYDMTFEMAIEKTHSWGVLVGLIVGILIGLIGFILIQKYSRKEDSDEMPPYDERQLMARGNAFKYSFFTMLAYNMAVFCLDVCEIDIPAERGITTLIGVILGMIVMITHCIWKDAYWALNQKRGALLVLFAIIGVMNTIMGISNFKDGIAIVNGRLTSDASNLCLGILFIWLGIVTAAKHIAEKLEDRE